jgi:serine/threonine protein phosphatase PrpC
MFFKFDAFGKYSVCAAAVCDGIGSFADSEFASGLTVNHIGEWFDRCCKSYTDIYINSEKKQKSARTVYEELKNSLREKLWLIHEIVLRETETRNFKAGTTVCVMLAVENLYCIYNTGDSRAYEISGTVKQITEDQSAEVGGRYMLVNCLGCSPGPSFKRYEGKIKKAATYLLATDGFYRRLDGKTAAKNFGKSKTSGEMENNIKLLLESSRAMGEKDDSTGISMKFI